SLAQAPDRRIWVILDELPTLHQVPSLQPGLAESRQFGGCFVLGVQVASALRDLYGRNGAETISGLCGTRVVLAAPDRDTAQWSADSLGRSEVEEISEGYSYGANTIRDGVSLTPRRELRALALPSEIMRLENLAGYLKFPGPFPVASVRLKYVSRPKAAARFVPRGEDGAGPPDRAEDAGEAPVEPGCDDGIAIPALPDESGAVPGKPSPAPEDAPGHGPRQGELDLIPLPGEAEADAAPSCPDAADGEGSGASEGDGSGQDEPDEPPAVIRDPAKTDGDSASPKPDETAVSADKAGGAGTGSEPSAGAASKKGAARPEWY
ncbi:MAG: type IV secretion system DNA-binding domain-containing protein, partial [Defluviicoccus sp.]|nr:type IV secretion system DNA-binding domain-containing protein [Defluviicoccus sp.]